MWNLEKIHIFIPKSAYGGGGFAGLGIIPKNIFSASLSRKETNSFQHSKRWIMDIVQFVQI